MVRFYLTLHERAGIVEDDTGLELRDLAAARQMALEAAREIMCADLTDGRLCLGSHIEIKDASGAVLLTVPFSDAVVISGLGDRAAPPA